ncbi:hypothetical protein ABBQ32_011368 [Trebouxia sp. C0010 RCD-2024]
MDTYMPYLIMRSTLENPRCYGARLYVGNDDDFGSMVCETGLDVWDQAIELVESSFGRRLPAKKQCVYVLENGRWSNQHPSFGLSTSISYRQPGACPKEDKWESADADSFVKVADAEGGVWFVAKVDNEDAYLIIPSEIANKRLRKAAVAPDVEVTERAVNKARLQESLSSKTALELDKMLEAHAGGNSLQKVPLTNIRGRAAGDPLFLISGAPPEFCGTLSVDGLIRIDCNNYPAHWQEIQLPEEVVLAWKEYRSQKADSSR